MLLTESRRPARVDAHGRLVRLAEQDRSRWDRGLVTEGQELVRACLRWNRPGPYQIQAAIVAVHSDAPTAADTDWRQIIQLYDQLLAVVPTPIVALNRAVAVAEVEGSAAALAVVDGLDLPRHHLLHATRADLLERLGRLPNSTRAPTTSSSNWRAAPARSAVCSRPPQGGSCRPTSPRALALVGAEPVAEATAGLPHGVGLGGAEVGEGAGDRAAREEAAEAYATTLQLTANGAERRFLGERHRTAAGG